MVQIGKESSPMYPPPINATLLLVDDEPFVRNAIRGVLHDYKDIQVVGEASDGVEAIQYARMLKPHVVLMDICMPKMNGIQATRVIKEEDPETIVIGLGIAKSETIPQPLIRAGAIAYLSKDCIVKELYPAITRYLDCSALPGQAVCEIVHTCHL
jgi:DNA-binding NarL/FixJ family response regulator